MESSYSRAKLPVEANAICRGVGILWAWRPRNRLDRHRGGGHPPTPATPSKNLDYEPALARVDKEHCELWRDVLPRVASIGVQI